MNSGQSSDHDKHPPFARAEADQIAADEEARRIRRLQRLMRERFRLQ